jgi:hypothetical protein
MTYVIYHMRHWTSHETRSDTYRVAGVALEVLEVDAGWRPRDEYLQFGLIEHLPIHTDPQPP